MDEEIIRELNSKIDPYEVIRLIAYRTDTIVLTEDRISLFCPIDKVDNKGMCEINKRSRTFMCKNCFKKGNLVQLYMWSKKISEEKAVKELKHFFSIALETEMKDKDSQGIRGTHFEKYEKLKSEVKEIDSLKKERMSNNSEWLQNALGDRAGNYQDTSNSSYQTPQPSGNENGCTATVLPELEKFIFVIYSEDDYFNNMKECDYRRFNSTNLSKINELGNVYVGLYTYKSSSVKLFGNMMKNGIVWMWGEPYVVFQKYDPLSYFAPFYAAKYSPFEKILYKGSDVNIKEYLKLVKKDNFSDFRFVTPDREYSIENDIVSSVEAFKDAVRFIRKLNDRFKIQMKEIRVYTDSHAYYVTFNPYLFGQRPSRKLYRVYENLALELTSTIVNEDRCIEHTEYNSLNLNVYHPGYFKKSINFKETSEYMWLFTAARFIEFSHDELIDTLHTRCDIRDSYFKAAQPIGSLSKSFWDIAESLGIPEQSTKSPAESDDHQADKVIKSDASVSRAEASGAPKEIPQREKTLASAKGNFLQFFNNKEYFMSNEKINSKGFNFFKKKISSGNTYLDKMLGSGFLNFFNYFITSHNYVSEYLFLKKIMTSFFKQSPANFIITDSNSDFTHLAGKEFENLKILNNDFKESEDFLSELEQLKYSSLLFLHSLDFSIEHRAFLKEVKQPVLIYSNTCRYEEFEKVSFQMHKGIKYIEVISVESRNNKCVVLYGANDKIDIEKFDIPFTL